MDHIGKTAVITYEDSLLPCGHSQSGCNTCSTLFILCHAACATCGATFRITGQSGHAVDVIGVAPADACPTLVIPIPQKDS